MLRNPIGPLKRRAYNLSPRNSMVECPTFNRNVAGSNPAGGTWPLNSVGRVSAS